MHKTLIIGDIHGCEYELQALLDKAGLAEGDVIIGAGDGVDRGPETPQVAAFFQNMPHARSVMGNHERKHMRAARHEVKLSISQQISKLQWGPNYPEALTWMSSLPLFIELEEAIIVHGYCEPGIALARQNPSVLCGTMGGDKILRERYDRPWYELYDGSKPVIVGHYNYNGTDQPFIYQDKIFGLDTDCVTGRALTGILLPSFQFVAVPSRGNLWMQVRRAYQAAKPKTSPPRVAPAPVWSEAQNRKLEALFQQLQEANRRWMAAAQTIPGYADLPPRQQTRLFAEWIGHKGITADLLQLMRQERLDLDLLRKIVHDPHRIEQLIDRVKEKP
jgi:serine/threonine protein phosphatase 1